MKTKTRRTKPVAKPAAKTAGNPANTAAKAEPATVLYLYGVSPHERRGVSIPNEGVDGAAKVEALPCAGVLCWISRVPREQFADRLAENMENLDWLATAGVRHQRAMAAIAEKVEVLPARFGTVFLTEQSLEKDVKSRKKDIAAAFKRVADAEEWGVKVFVERAPAPKKTVAVSSGVEYLKRKAALQNARPKRAVVDDEVRAFMSALYKLAVAQVEGGKVSGAQPNLQWQASLLIKRGKRKQFEDLLKRFASKWSEEKRIECNGPWPPYSFVTIHGS